MAQFNKLARWYTTTAFLLLNTIILFIILNLVLQLAMSTWHSAAKDNDKPSHGFSAESLRKVYPNLSDAERTELLSEIWERPFVYEQFVEFREQPTHGKYVNVTEQGFRVNPPQGPWPIDPKNYNIFVFGGSTTFGYGVADDQTIPFYLQQLFPKHGDKQTCVYNFASGFYYSTQERIQFEQMLQSGVKPDFALFIDGLNDFYHASGVLPFTTQLKTAMDPNHRFGRDALEMLRMLPIGRATAYLARRGKPADQTVPADPKVLAQVIHNYVWNKNAIEAIGKQNGVPTAFVFQPVPMYKYDMNFHPFAGKDWYEHKNAFAGYPLMAEYVAQHPMGDDFLWLADMQVGIQKELYCDQIHYTPEFSREIAEEIGKLLESRIEQSAPTTQQF